MTDVPRPSQVAQRLVREVRLPLLSHDMLPSSIHFDTSTVPTAFMHANHREISMMVMNAESYLERTDELIADLRHAVDLSKRIQSGELARQGWFQKFKRLDYQIFKGVRIPTDFGAWRRVDKTDETHLTVMAADYTNEYESVAVRHYVALDEHKRLMREAQATIAQVVSTAVEQGVFKGIASATEKHLETLEETRNAKADVERQMQELQRRLDKLNELEQQHVAREKLERERAALRAAERVERERRKAERATTRNRAGYVYLLKQINGEYYKIGRTSNPDDRLSTFNVKLPFEVEYEHLIQTDDMYALESKLHAKYAHCRMSGEWFALTPQDLLDIVTHTE